MLGAANSTGVCDGLVLAVPVEIPGRRADGGRREVVSAADADGDAGDDRRRAYGGPRTRGRTSRDVTAGRKGGLPSRGGARVRTTDRRGDFGDTRRAVESGHLIYFRNRRKSRAGELVLRTPEVSLGVSASASLRRRREHRALNPQTQEPSQPVLASVEASTLTISVLVWHSHEFVDRGLYLEI